MKTHFSAIVLIPLALISCSRRRAVPGAEPGATLKSLSERKAGEVYWTDPLEGGRLQADISKITGVSPDVRVSPLMALAARDGRADIYPSLAGFGPLDVSALPPELLAAAESFAAAIVGGGDADPFMAAHGLFSLALFYQDVLGAGQGGFTDYIVGEPFVSGDEYEVPVRLLRSESSHIDTRLFFVREGGAWKIDQIQFK